MSEVKDNTEEEKKARIAKWLAIWAERTNVPIKVKMEREIAYWKNRAEGVESENRYLINMFQFFLETYEDSPNESPDVELEESDESDDKYDAAAAAAEKQKEKELKDAVDNPVDDYLIIQHQNLIKALERLGM